LWPVTTISLRLYANLEMPRVACRSQTRFGTLHLGGISPERLVLGFFTEKKIICAITDHPVSA
jgi:hypothetical protein